MDQTKVIIIGGGLAGLTAAIHLAQNGLFVSLFEKEDFPYHKVCGEYLSKEVLPYFNLLEIPINELNPQNISCLQYSTRSGKFLEADLPLGGLGISRYALDDLLYHTAVKKGVAIHRERVLSVEFSNDHHTVFTSQGEYKAHFVLGAYGKRSNLDKEFQREFFQKPAPWVAVKSHFENKGFPNDLVALHNFKGGYCGLSKTESGAVNVCYLSTYNSFKHAKDPQLFIDNVLRKNPFLDRFFSESKELFERPISIGQVSFSPKSAVNEHIFMLGDAAGLIHPLCGNGMAMAIHSAKIASEVLLGHLKIENRARAEVEREYQKQWEEHFRKRLTTGKWLQKILLKDSLADFSQAVISKMPFLLPKIIKQTHGKPLL